ncbi:MAG TPA: aspartyl protease family protein [Gemmatimonadaceae bacterium]
MTPLSVFVALCVACAISACAPKKPVIIETPVIIDAPVAVTIDPDVAATARRAGPSPSKTYWEGMRNLDPDYTKRHPVSTEESRFAEALRLVLSGNVSDAELVLDSLRINTPDSLVRMASWVMLSAMLQYQDKWDILAEIAPKRTDLPPGTERNRAAVEEWAAILGKVPKRVVEIPTRPSKAGLTLSMAGTPVISVMLNGKQRFFWLDTGASISIVSSDVAADAGMTPLSHDTLEIVTATGRIPALPSLISNLQFAGVTIRNAKAMIVGVELMQVRDVDVKGPPIAVRIDGIVGFDILNLLRVRFDYSTGTVTVSQPATPPRSKSRTQRTFFWIGTPMVRLVTSRGVPLNFVLDTGAQETYATEMLAIKTGVRTRPGERRSVRGLAGEQRFRGRFIGDIRLWLGPQRLDFERLLIFAPQLSSFGTIDGMLGSDIMRTGIVTLDAKNGLFTIEQPPGPTLRLREEED